MKRANLLFQIIVLLAVTVHINAQSPNKRNTPVGVGDVAPDFTLADQDEKKITLSAARGESPVVLVFYRGYW